MNWQLHDVRTEDDLIRGKWCGQSDTPFLANKQAPGTVDIEGQLIRSSEVCLYWYIANKQHVDHTSTWLPVAKGGAYCYEKRVWSYLEHLGVFLAGDLGKWVGVGCVGVWVGRAR